MAFSETNPDKSVNPEDMPSFEETNTVSDDVRGRTHRAQFIHPD
jgi:hypothetical protein